MGVGVAKTKTCVLFFNSGYSWFIYTPTKKSNLSQIFKIPTKSSEIPIPTSKTPISYTISSNPSKINHLSHFQTQKSNFHLIKNSPTISKSSLFISTFTDNDFSPKKSSNSILSPYSPQGVLKNCTQNYSNKRITI